MSALREWLAMDGFAWPWMLLAIPLPLLVHLLLPARGGNGAALRVPWGERLQRIANAGSVAAKPRGLPWLALIAWCLLCIAAARPQQLGPAIAPPQVGRDLMLAVDLSASMGEEDMELGGRIVDRLTAAKAVLAEYPNLNMVGEEWSANPAVVAHWQRGKANANGHVPYMPSMIDFPGQIALRTALVQPIGWEQDWTPLYEALANDFVYPDPDALVVFAENHDTSRLLAHVDGDLDLWKTGMAWLATVRGTPQFYYGSEVLLRGPKERNDGLLRADMPGGWANDKANAFTGAALSAKQRDAQDYIRTLFNWRKRSPVLHAGKLTHYAPDDGIYVYFRHDGKHTVMVALNRNAEAKPLALDRFARFLADTAGARDALTGKPVRLGKTLQVPAKAAVLLEISSQAN